MGWKSIESPFDGGVLRGISSLGRGRAVVRRPDETGWRLQALGTLKLILLRTGAGGSMDRLDFAVLMLLGLWS